MFFCSTMFNTFDDVVIIIIRSDIIENTFYVVEVVVDVDEVVKVVECFDVVDVVGVVFVPQGKDRTSSSPFSYSFCAINGNSEPTDPPSFSSWVTDFRNGGTWERDLN